ncbi:P2X purinoceptor 4a-like [Hetaerina americana]|uniref:P2X purinoceptor 4a-like n=1 Tax=Hetaerina americana TaxID=62018 RepID=UPI003A7F2EF6
MGYQEFKTADSAVSIKVKGAVLTNISKEDFQIKESYTHLYNRLWDQANQNIVPLSGESFFFMTNILITPNQTLTKCDEDPHIKEAHCGDHLPPCEPGAFINTGHGANTGQCVESSNEPGIKGAIMTFKINWDCNLNYDFDEYCIPKYTIRRLDKANLNDFEGWNFRYAYQHELDRRTLLKVYGVKFTVEVNAMGQRFSFLPTMINIGTGLALMGLCQGLEKGQAITGAYYCTLLNKLCDALKNKWHGRIIKGICPLADNAPAHSS